MRIISGTAKGRRLKSPRQAVRPTQDRVKAGMFDSLGDRVVGAQVLDLFAGSGGLGLEALSRGAAEVVFVEVDRSASTAIRENLRSLGFDGRAQVWRERWATAVRKLAARGDTFDLVICDAPYDTKATLDVLTVLDTASILAERGIVVTECSKREVLPKRVGALLNTRRKAFGDTQLAFWKRTED